MLSELQNNNNNGTNKAVTFYLFYSGLLKVLFEWHKFICATMYFLQQWKYFRNSYKQVMMQSFKSYLLKQN